MMALVYKSHIPPTLAVATLTRVRRSQLKPSSVVLGHPTTIEDLLEQAAAKLQVLRFR